MSDIIPNSVLSCLVHLLYNGEYNALVNIHVKYTSHFGYYKTRNISHACFYLYNYFNLVSLNHGSW